MTNFTTAAEAAAFYGPEWYDDAFDYEYLPTCQFPVADPCSPGGESDCGEPAVAYGWWGDDYDGGWRLCQKHLDTIRAAEPKPGEVERYLKNILEGQPTEEKGLDE